MMDTQPQAQLFLADSRGVSQTDFFQRYHTFNSGSYAAEGRDPFGPICLLNEDTLRAGASLKMLVETNTDVILIPVVGGLEYQSDVKSDFLDAGQVGRLSLAAGISYTIVNPYETETITLLQLWLTNSAPGGTPGFQQTSFDLSLQNALLPLFNGSGSKGYIGRYDGRAEDTYTVSKQDSGVFVFILQGVFEVANRLLHAKDGLALLNITEVEFEALSNDAILVLLEV